MAKYLCTSESVTEGHPDKVCDAISDAILDSLLSQDKESHVACETLATNGLVVVSGEVRSSGSLDVESIVKTTLEDIGYTDEARGMDSDNIEIRSIIHEQSPEIAQGVDSDDVSEQGAGDQGLMFGFACKETEELMPLPIQIAQRLTEKLARIRKDGTLPWLRPDGKSQVTVEYDGFTPVRITKVVIATQHDDMLKEHGSEENELSFVKKEVIDHIITPVLEGYGIPFEDEFIVNGTGRFVYGGPAADTGLTGRKIIVDTYGGMARHGGGAFSGKDPSKVDRSAAYAGRYVAKNIVAAGLARRCELQVSYAIGVAEPTSISVNTFGTATLADDASVALIRENFDLRPKGLINMLDLKRPIYRTTAAYGHFGRSGDSFTWERTDKAETLRTAASL